MRFRRFMADIQPPSGGFSTTFLEQFDLTFWREPEGGISHNLRTAVIDPSGRVRKIFIGNKWASEELVTEMVKAANVSK